MPRGLSIHLQSSYCRSLRCNYQLRPPKSLERGPLPRYSPPPVRPRLTAASAAAATVFTGFGLVDLEAASVDLFAVELSDGRIAFLG